MKIAFIARLSHEIDKNAPSGISVFSYSLISKLAENPQIEKIDVFGIGKNYFKNKKINFVNVLPSSQKEFSEKAKISTVLGNYNPIQLKEHLLFNLNIKAYNIISENNYDVIHDNSTSPIFYALKNFLKAKVVTTIHTPINSEVIYLPLKLNLLNNKRHYFISISNFQKEVAKKNKIPIKEMIYNGINIDDFKFFDNSQFKNQYILWHGRIGKTDNKGLLEAISVNNAIKRKMHVVGNIVDKDYFQNEVKTNITSDIQFFDGNNNLVTKNKYYQNATCFLYPLMWDEPFGLVFLESMACGTPVVAFSRGAASEIIEDGKTGFLVNSSNKDKRGNWIIKKTGIDGLKEAANKIYSMDPKDYQKMRENCRERIEKNFTDKIMAENYIKIYKKL